MLKKDTVWKCASYTRLSREDKAVAESNSITNQKELIREHLKSMPEICLSMEVEDDGYSGVDFSRPGFEGLMEEIKAGNINCVIVKDLSRFGRNYIQVGDYIERIFPVMGVRFISINDAFDSINEKSSADEILIPFKNLMNESYLRDVSIKIRSQLEIKRKKGEYIGAFAPYGYKKSPKDKHQLIIDKHTSNIVMQIFKWKVEGYSQSKIAEKLNKLGELSPYACRKKNGERYNTSFQEKVATEWSARAIGRILTNRVYTGVLVQGKTTTPSHKVKTLVVKPEEDWAIVENTHEAIVERPLFETVARVLQMDTRVGPSCEKVYLFSGLTICGECGEPICRKEILADGQKYSYLHCSAYKKYKNCSSHALRESALADIVWIAIQNQIKSVLDCEAVLADLSPETFKKRELERLKANLSQQHAEKEIIIRSELSLYEDYKSGMFTLEEYENYRGIYAAKERAVELAIENIQIELTKKESATTVDVSWIAYFKQYRSVKELSRSLLVSLVKEIVIFDDTCVEIEFLYQDKMAEFISLSKDVKAISFPQQEVLDA